MQHKIRVINQPLSTNLCVTLVGNLLTMCSISPQYSTSYSNHESLLLLRSQTNEFLGPLIFIQLWNLCVLQYWILIIKYWKYDIVFFLPLGFILLLPTPTPFFIHQLSYVVLSMCSLLQFLPNVAPPALSIS
jgi:hypothetical protein